MGDLAEQMKDEKTRNALIVEAALGNADVKLTEALGKSKHGQQRPTDEQVQSAIDVSTHADTVTDLQRMLLYVQKETQERTGTAVPAEDKITINGDWNDPATVKALDGVLKEAKVDPAHDAMNGTFDVFGAFTKALDRKEPLPDGKKRKGDQTTSEAGWLGGEFRFPKDVGEALDRLQQQPEYQLQQPQKFEVIDVSNAPHHHQMPRHRSGNSIPKTRDLSELKQPANRGQ